MSRAAGTEMTSAHGERSGVFSVADCDRYAADALAAAARADSASDRKQHLDRAAMFAHCSKEARRQAACDASSDLSAISCPVAAPMAQR